MRTSDQAIILHWLSGFGFPSCSIVNHFKSTFSWGINRLFLSRHFSFHKKTLICMLYQQWKMIHRSNYQTVCFQQNMKRNHVKTIFKNDATWWYITATDFSFYLVCRLKKNLKFQNNRVIFHATKHSWEEKIFINSKNTNNSLKKHCKSVSQNGDSRITFGFRFTDSPLCLFAICRPFVPVRRHCVGQTWSTSPLPPLRRSCWTFGSSLGARPWRKK